MHKTQTNKTSVRALCVVLVVACSTSVALFAQSVRLAPPNHRVGGDQSADSVPDAASEVDSVAARTGTSRATGSSRAGTLAPSPESSSSMATARRVAGGSVIDESQLISTESVEAPAKKPAVSIEFSGKNQKPRFERQPTKQRGWVKDDTSYTDFEAVEIVVKEPVEHAEEVELFDETPVPTQADPNAMVPMFPQEETYGVPGVVYSADDQKRQPTDAPSPGETEPVGRSRIATAEKGPSEESDEFAENAQKLQQRLIIDDHAPATVHTGKEWYVPLPRLTHVQVGRRDKIRECLEFYYTRMLNSRDDSPWSMMHHMIAWGTDSRIWIGAPGGRHESCIGWLCANGPCEGERLLYARNDLVYARTGPGLQGHEGQFLAMLAQTRVRADQPIQIEDTRYSVKQLIEQEKRSCRPGTELTFRLIGLVHYLDTDASWTSSDGEDWDIQRLIREEMHQPINGTTCGGTHRLMGMTYAVRRRQQEDKPLDGEFQRADVFTRRYMRMAYDMQNPSGTFSSDFWRSRGSWGDLNRKLKTTGHMLEWMVFSADHEDLQDPRMIAAVDWLTDMLTENRYYDFEKGPLGHGVRALALYDERVFGSKPGDRDYQVPSVPPNLKPRTVAKTPSKQATKRRTPTPTTTPSPDTRRRGGLFNSFRRK